MSEKKSKEKKTNYKMKSNDKVKVVVSSLKEDNTNDLKTEHEENNKISFFKTLFYSTIRPDKIDIALKSYSTWFSYIVKLILILSIILGTFLAFGMIKNIENIKTIAQELPEIVFKDGEIKGDVDKVFFDESSQRLVILNTVDDVFKVREKYKDKIDEVDQYVLISKKEIYVEPGNMLEYSKLNLLQDKELKNEDIIKYIDSFLKLKFITVISGTIAAAIILTILVAITIFIGKLLITIFTINSLKTLDLNLITKLSAYLSSMPLIVYTILNSLQAVEVLPRNINLFLIYALIYLIYLIITLYILIKKQKTITVIKEINKIKRVFEDDEKNIEETMRQLERDAKEKKDAKKDLKKKNKKTKKGKSNKKDKDDEILEGA